MKKQTKAPITLSKSKLLLYLQCHRRLWLEINSQVPRQESAETLANFAVGNQVGEIARQIYDPAGKGTFLDRDAMGYEAAFASTPPLLSSSQPIFEAGFKAEGAQVFADVMLPVKKGGKRAWRMVEVKSSSSVKDYHRDDAAIQSFVTRRAGVPLASIAVAHIDLSWVYRGGGDYSGLLKEVDLTGEAFTREDEVIQWIAGAKKVVKKRLEPVVTTGQRCIKPYPCSFLEYCQSKEPQAKHPVQWLPSVQTKALKAAIVDGGLTEIRDVPDDLLNEIQLRVKKHTLSKKVYFDAKGAATDLAQYKLPAYFLDFETINPAVPMRKGTKPFQQIPFQFSVHILSRAGTLKKAGFLDLSGKDPSKPLAEALISACGLSGPVFAYKASFEKKCIADLAARFSRLRTALLAINARMVDLLPVAQQHYYHPSQQGSWSIKCVLPALVPELSYGKLDEVQDGGAAQRAFLEAIDRKTSAGRLAVIHKRLTDYCCLDTYAMVRLWQAFSGHTDFNI